MAFTIEEIDVTNVPEELECWFPDGSKDCELSPMARHYFIKKDERVVSMVWVPYEPEYAEQFGYGVWCPDIFCEIYPPYSSTAWLDTHDEVEVAVLFDSVRPDWSKKTLCPTCTDTQ